MRSIPNSGLLPAEEPAENRSAVIVQDQDPVVAFLSHAHSYGLTGPVEVLETHISRVFLVGDRAFKMKRAVKLPYVDFSTPQLRLATCEKEVRYNAPAAPGLYLGVKTIHRDANGSLQFGDGGTLVDAVVEMVRFDQALLADRLALAACIMTSRDLVERRDIAKVDVPTLIGVGTKDDIAGSAQELAELMPHATALDIPGRDHMLAVGDRVFKKAVLEFYAALA